MERVGAPLEPDTGRRVWEVEEEEEEEGVGTVYRETRRVLSVGVG